MPVRTHVDESGLGVGFSIFATTTGKDCVTRVTLTYAITESRVINPATAAVTPRIDRLRAMTVSASANNAQNPAGCPRRHDPPVGPMERAIHSSLHPNLFAIWGVMLACFFAGSSEMGNHYRNPPIRPTARGWFSWNGYIRCNPNWIDGRACYGSLRGPRHAGGSAGPTGHYDDVG